MHLHNSMPADKFFDDEVFSRKGTKKKRREERKLNKQHQQESLPKIISITPLTQNQQRTFKAFAEGKNLILHGSPGTGKTFISLYLALEATLSGNAPKPIVIIRSVVPSRDMGFLPGSAKEKAAVYESPYVSICNELIPTKQNAYDFLKGKHFIEFSTTSFLRGLTFRHNTVIVDECQNMSEAEIHTIITRLGEGCRIIFCGDFGQKDYMKEQSGMPTLLQIAKRMKSLTEIKFGTDDIVRSGFVKEYLLAKNEYENTLME